MSRQIALIVAHDAARAIGLDGQLPWHLPADLKRFRALTTGHTVVMGRKTHESIGRLLPNRDNWVLTRDPDWRGANGIRCLGSWAEVLDQHQQGTLWVIGGGQIYQVALPDVDRIEATEVHTTLARADAWFPALPQADWQPLARQAHQSDQQHAHAYDFVSWVRRASPG
jgi:dihydrofolate reductase